MGWDLSVWSQVLSGTIGTLLGVRASPSWCRYNFSISHMRQVLKASVSSLVSTSLRYYSPTHITSQSASHFHPQAFTGDTRSSGTIDLPSLRQHMFTGSLWLKDWKCQALRGWDLGSPLLISGQYVVLIYLANEELTFLSGCILLKW